MLTNRLVLWDVDHTLIETGGVGREVFAAAFAEVTGTPMKDMAEVSGRPELVIFGETLDMHGIPRSDDYFERFIDLQAGDYEERAHEMRLRGRVLPGALNALQALSRRTRHHSVRPDREHEGVSGSQAEDLRVEPPP